MIAFQTQRFQAISSLLLPLLPVAREDTLQPQELLNESHLVHCAHHGGAYGAELACGVVIRRAVGSHAVAWAAEYVVRPRCFTIIVIKLTSNA